MVAERLTIDFETLARLIAGRHGNPVRVVCPQCAPSCRSPKNRKRPTLAIWPKHGFASYSCARCGINGYARDGAAPAIDRPVLERQRAEHAAQRRADAEKKRCRALELWREAGPIVGSLAETYLRSRAILELPPAANEVLRFHPRCPFGDERHPCMLALMRDAITDAPRAIQRTALTQAGQKIDRMTLGAKAGAAVKLWPDSDVTQGLVIAEGTETALAAATRVEHRGTLLRPVWAVADAGNMETFPVLAGIDALTILVDHDASGTGQAAAQACARRWREAGREVIRLTPRELDTDFADIVVSVA